LSLLVSAFFLVKEIDHNPHSVIAELEYINVKNGLGKILWSMKRNYSSNSGTNALIVDYNKDGKMSY